MFKFFFGFEVFFSQKMGRVSRVLGGNVEGGRVHSKGNIPLS